MNAKKKELKMSDLLVYYSPTRTGPPQGTTILIATTREQLVEHVNRTEWDIMDKIICPASLWTTFRGRPEGSQWSYREHPGGNVVIRRRR